MPIRKIEEVRPSDCKYGTRIGDRVEINSNTYLQVKCRQCSKDRGEDVFHYIRIS